MMREEFKRLMCELIDENYSDIESAYMSADESVDKRTFARAFFLKSMTWVRKITEARATVNRYSEEIKKLNVKVAEANCLLDSLTRV